MKMLFFSSEQAEVERVRKEFLDAGIPCEVHDGTRVNGHAPDMELWIQNDGDSYRALMLCVQRGVGFGKRALRKPGLAEDTAQEEEAAQGESHSMAG